MGDDRKIIKHVPCTFCGCLCDDLEIEIKNNEIVGNVNGCVISKERFLGVKKNRIESAVLRKKEVPVEQAIKYSVKLLLQARRPLIYGLSSTENDTHREAYKIAEITKGIVDNTSSVCHGPSIIGNQESGETGAMLAEIRHRADLVIYWGANPAAAHPRHIPRYIRQPGEYIKDPKNDREIWVFDIRKTSTARLADRFYRLTPGTDLEVFLALRALVRGHPIDIEGIGDLSITDLEEIAKVLKSVRYGVLFFGLGLTQSKGKHRNVDAAIKLVQDLNSYTKWNMLPMRGHYNVTGANKTSVWQTGYPFSVDFARGYPRYQPGEYSAVDLLLRKEIDLLLNIAADPVAHFPRGAVQYLSKIPVINIDPKYNLTARIAEVNIPSAIAGIECDGAATRMDGLPLYLKKLVEPPADILPDREIMSRIYQGLLEGKSE